MKEVKYRIFDKINSIMYTNEFVSTFDFESKCAWVKARGKGGRWVYFKDAEIIQYTGLSDKDGIEIFEGDILEVWQDTEHIPNRDSGGGIIDFDHEEGWVQLGVVEFHSCSFAYKTVKTLEGKHEEVHLPIDWLTNYGVVGNIYENPELITNHDTSKTQ